LDTYRIARTAVIVANFLIVLAVFINQIIRFHFLGQETDAVYSSVLAVVCGIYLSR
jgi:hypothetical protein